MFASERQKTLERFSKRIKVSDSGCWEWQGYCGPYGHMSVNGTQIRVHRLSVMLFKGEEIPKGSVVMHICQNHKCANPDHLKIATYKENMEHDKLGTHFSNCLKCGREKSNGNLLVAGRSHLCRACVIETRRRHHKKHIEYLRKWRAARRGAKQPKTTCRNGHPWVPENIYHNEKTGWNYCKLCRRERHPSSSARSILKSGGQQP